MNRYRIEYGKIYRYEEKKEAYVFYGFVISYTEKEIREMKETKV